VNRKIICCLLVLAFVVLSFSGCHRPTLEADEIIAKTNSHIVYRVDNVCYMEFFNEVPYNGYEGTTGHKYIDFESLDELKKTILENKFTPYQQWELECVYKDDIIEVVDVEHMWSPVYPDDVSLEEIQWFTYSCDFVLLSESDIAKMEATWFSNSVTLTSAENSYIEDEENEYERKDKTVETVINNDKTRQYIRYSDNPSMIHVSSFYTLEKENYTAEIYELYRYKLDTETNTFVETGIPTLIELKFYGENLVAQIRLTDFTSRPTEEWLLSFGMEPFVPEE